MEYKTWIKKLSLREQALLLTGADSWHTNPIIRLGIPPVMMSDGPNGLRKEEKLGKFGRTTIKSVCYPSATALAASWDRTLMTQLGITLANECKAKRVSVLLGPGTNIKRSPLCGRNFEYYSEDPILAGELAASYINAVQSEGVGTSLKHFAANNTETARMMSNSVVDERALREIYLRPFEIAVKKAQPWTIMCAYNKINGTYCAENKHIITDVLRNEWGFKGVAISDWAAVNDRIASLNAGLDLEMPGTGYVNVRSIASAYRKGKVSGEKIEKSASRVLELVTNAETLLKQPVQQIDIEAHHKFAAQVAEQCAVLLKNEGALLPLTPGEKVAVIGERAEKPMYQGCGSAQINAYRVDSPLDALRAADVDVKYAPGYHIDKAGTVDADLINEACAVASRSNVALVFVSPDEIDFCEGTDRTTMALPFPQTELINAICKVNPNVAVIIASGSNVEMPWVDMPRAIMQTYLLGEASGTAIADLLTGKISPSGKLPESYPLTFDSTPCPNNYQTDKDKNVLYKESIYVGYRYYEKTGTPVLFPFGYGLSYSKFDYSNLTLSANTITPDDKLTLTFTLTNSGNYNASEIAQVYVAKKDSLLYRAPKELKEFTKVFIVAGSPQTVTVELDRRAFEYYSVKLGRFAVESGKYDIMVGSSSADIRLTASVEVNSPDDLSKEVDYMHAAPKYFSGDIKNVTDEDFEDIFGGYMDNFKEFRTDDRIRRSDCIADTMHTTRGKIIADFIEMLSGKLFPADPTMRAIVYNSVMYIPMNRFVYNTKGICTDEAIDALVHYLNHGTALETAQLVVRGLPELVLNVVSPVIRSVVEKKGRA